MNFSHNSYPFVQDTNFLYYVGVNMPSCACLIDVEKNKTIFYMNEKTVHDIIWIGKTKSVKSWGEDCGADEIKALSELFLLDFNFKVVFLGNLLFGLLLVTLFLRKLSSDGVIQLVTTVRTKGKIIFVS